MPFTIRSNLINADTFKFQGTSQEAEEQLSKLREWVLPSGELKPGALQLVKSWDSKSITLRRRQWYQFWKFVSVGIDTGRATDYVKSLVEAVKKSDGNNEGVANNATATEPLSKYLSEKKKKLLTADLQHTLSVMRLHGDINAHKTDGVQVSDLSKESIPIKISAQPVITVENEPVTPVKKKAEERAIKQAKEKARTKFFDEFKTKVLPSIGITLGDNIGAGGMAKVYSALVAGSNERFVMKVENEVKMVPITGAGELPFHYRGDLAACFLNKLKNMTKPIFVIVALQKEPNGSIEYHYVSAREAELFVNEIGKKHPHAKAGIVAQLMELAPGEELHKYIRGDEKKSIKKIDFSLLNDASRQKFNQVMNSLLCYLITALDNNYLHGDIKPANVMLHQKEDGANNILELCLIDGGLAAYNEGKELNLKTCQGTFMYLSPRIVLAYLVADAAAAAVRAAGRNPSPQLAAAALAATKTASKTYGAEVDAYSIAMLLLEMIDPDYFNIIHGCGHGVGNKFLNNLYEEKVRGGIQESKYLEHYMQLARILASFSPHETTNFKVLDIDKVTNATIQKLIDLCFQVSAGGEEGENAFNELKTTFEKWQKVNNFSNPTESSLKGTAR